MVVSLTVSHKLVSEPLPSTSPRESKLAWWARACCKLEGEASSS